MGRARVFFRFLARGLQRFGHTITLFHFQEDGRVLPFRALVKFVSYSYFLVGIRVYQDRDWRLTLSSATPMGRFGHVGKGELIRRLGERFLMFFLYPRRRFLIFLASRVSRLYHEVKARFVMTSDIVRGNKRLVIRHFRVHL